MTRFSSLFLSLVVLAPVAYALMTQAAQIIA